MNKITKDNWSSSFTLVGKPVIKPYTFKMDAVNEKGNWCYNALALEVDCGEKHGTVRADMMGGYSTDPNRTSIIYAHGKKPDGKDNFKDSIRVDWDDRFNDDILADVGDMCFMTVGIEKTTEGKIFKKKFLSEYDFIAYLQKHLTEDMVIKVDGRLEYTTWEGKTQVRKKIQRVELSKIDDPSKYYARFVQSFLFDKDSATKQNIDKTTGVMSIDVRVLDYIKEINGVLYKGQYPYHVSVDFDMPLHNQAQCEALMEKVFNVKRDITQMTWVGDFIEDGATVEATIDDISDDIKELLGVALDEEEVLATCATNGNTVRRMVLRKPYIKLVGENKTPTLQKFEEKYTEEDLVIDLAEEDEELPFDEEDNANSGSDDVSSWLY